MIHATNLYGLENIILNSGLDNRLSLSKKGIAVSGGMAEAYYEQPIVETSAYTLRSEVPLVP